MVQLKKKNGAENFQFSDLNLGRKSGRKKFLFSKKSTINGKINSLQEDTVFTTYLYHFYSSPERIGMLYNLKIKNQAPSAEKKYFICFYLGRNLSKELKDKLRESWPGASTISAFEKYNN
jgi:hypothetical protein